MTTFHDLKSKYAKLSSRNGKTSRLAERLSQVSSIAGLAGIIKGAKKNIVIIGANPVLSGGQASLEKGGACTNYAAYLKNVPFLFQGAVPGKQFDRAFFVLKDENQLGALQGMFKKKCTVPEGNVLYSSDGRILSLKDAQPEAYSRLAVLLSDQNTGAVLAFGIGIAPSEGARGADDYLQNSIADMRAFLIEHGRKFVQVVTNKLLVAPPEMRA